MHNTPLFPIRRSLWYLLIFLVYSEAFGQVVVFSDDFTDNSDPAWTTSGNLSGSAWTVFRPGDDWGARRNDNPFQLELTNDVGANANLAGYCLTSTTSSSFSAPYNTTLQNGGIVTWTFNMRQIRTDPSGFNSSNYGVAFILAGESASNNSSGDGYAVVLGQIGSDDPIRLVRYNTGLNSDADLTNLIISNTSGLTDFGLEHLSIKVTYNPCNGGQWELFLRNDGASFLNPLSGTLISQGTVTDNTYTGIPLTMMAAYWKGSITGDQTAFFNNITVSVTPPPSFDPGSNPTVCAGTTSANLTYSSLMGSPDQYDIDWNAAAEAQGFVDVNSATLPTSPISLVVPGSATPNTYNGTLTLINSSTTCESDPYPISVTITVSSCADPSTMQWLLLDENQSNGSCTSSSDCDLNTICYGLEYTPLYTGNVTSYTTRWWAECYNGSDPVLSNVSCTMANNSNTIPGCPGFGLVIMNSSGNTGNLPVTAGIPVILHQVCFVIPNTGVIDVYPDTTIPGAPPLTVSIDSADMGGFEDDTILNKIPLTIDSLVDCAILPLRWLSFTAEPVKAFVSGLDWVTAEEFNTAYFDIQRSNDGGRTFSSIGQKQAHGTSSDVHTYHFTDEHARAGTNYYRLKQIDVDGRFEYSPVRPVTFEAKGFTYKVFPNPANDFVNIQLIKAETAGDIQLHDITGKIILTRTFEPGYHSIQLPLPYMPSGLYQMTIRTGEQKFIEKLMIISSGR